MRNKESLAASGRWTIQAGKVIYGFAIIFLLFLIMVSLRYSSDGYEVSASTPQQFALLLTGGIVLSAGLCVVSHCLEKTPKICCVVTEFGIFAAVMFFSAWWIANSANLPQGDAKSIYDIAYRAMNHDLLPIAPTGSYMSLWPFQAGLVLFVETIFRLVPNADEMSVQWMYVPFMALSLLSGYMIVKKLFASVRIRVIWCVLMGLCFPYYLYINNMYGEVPSIALLFFALWMMMGYLENPAWHKMVLAFMGVASMVAVKRNTLIFSIACVLTVGVLLFEYRKKKYLLLILMVVTATAAGAVLPGKFYEYRAKNTMGKGVPAISYIAMGMQWSEGRIPGGWNGYHSDLFMNCDYNAEETAKISAESVRDSLDYMLKHPAYAAAFFSGKSISQWAREDYGCLYATLEFYGNRTEAAWQIYRGKAKEWILSVMSIHQSVIYTGAALFCLFGVGSLGKGRKRREEADGIGELTKLMLLVTFIGGFLFSLIWESGARYVMPYVIMLIPYAACGIDKMGCLIIDLYAKRKGIA